MADIPDCGEDRCLDELMLTTIDKRQTGLTLIMCFFTGEVPPPHCAAMLRLPAPPTGTKVTDGLYRQIDAAIELNPAVHDGAMIMGRNRTSEDYVIRGWSYRLFPPSNELLQEANRGSAFNSGFAMSMVESIDFLYLSSQNGLNKFVRGKHILLR